MGEGIAPARPGRLHVEFLQNLHRHGVVAAGEEANRDLASVPISIWSSKEDEDEMKRDRDAGVVRVIISFESAKSDAILPELDRWAKLAANVK